MHDTTAVRDTIERFHDAINQRRPADVAALFAEHGVWEIAPPYNLRFEGVAAIEKGVTGTIGATEVLVQACGPVVIDFRDADHATARTSMQEFGRFHDGSAMHVAGTYHDELVRQPDGAWRFVHRRLVPHYADDLPVPGKILFTRDPATGK